MEKTSEKTESISARSENSKGMSVFNKDSYLIFFYKKTERIVSALYLVTNLIPQGEPLRMSIREKGMKLIDEAIALTGKRQIQGEPFQLIATSLVELISFIEVGYLSGHISEMNHAILRDEMLMLLDLIEAKERPDMQKSSSVGKELFTLSEDYFKQEEASTEGVERSIDTVRQFERGRGGGIHTVHDLRRKIVLEKERKFDGLVRKDITPHITSSSDKAVSADNVPEYRSGGALGHGVAHEKKIDRRDIILSLLRERSNLNIKDFSVVIKDCSEKTIQRELLSLVAEGVLKKEGERRWSTYSIV